MEYAKDKMSLEEGIKREWIITNGLGGYCSSTIIGANTRKYHGLLVAPLTPPARRHLILSKLDESIQTDGKKYNLYTNMCKNYISDGYKYLQSFKKDYIPVFEYEVAGINIKKSICMEYRKNTVVLVYEIKNNDKDSILTLAPIMNLRDFHTVTANYEFDLRQNINKNKVKIVINRQSETPIYMNLTNGKYIKHENDKFNNMYYIEEEKRGMAAEENLIVPGRYEIELAPNEEKTITFVCSLEENIEEIDGKEIIKKEISRINKLIDKSNLLNSENEELVKTYIIASDNFVVYRPSFALYTIIAGYPWFLDWGRDSLISFEGLLLLSNRYEIAKEVLLTYIRDIKFGLVPNGYSGYDNRPLYNSVDASLLLFETVSKYLKYTGDYKFIKDEIYPILENIIENYCSGIDVDKNNIYLDTDGLIVSGTENTQNTWMDVKFAGKAVTPRNGKAVEVNSLWYNANEIMAELSLKFGHLISAKKYKELAKKCKKSFTEKFYNEKTKCLYDVLGDSKIRPNQLFALSLTYQVIEPDSEIAENIIKVIEKQLLNPYGLKTLAKGEENYVEIYEGDEKQRDTSYHQGITWTWLLGLYYNSLKNKLKATKDKGDKEKVQTKINKFINKTEKIFTKEINESGCIGSIAEIYDSVEPQLPKGAFAQCWSVAEIFRIIIGKE